MFASVQVFKRAGVFLILTLITSVVLSESEAKDYRSKFTGAMFEQLQREGVPVLIDVHAQWCPTCQRQQWLIDDYFESNPGSNVKVLVIDFDNDKKWVKHFKAPRQSTLFIYKNNEKKWFSVAETRKRFLHQALKSVDGENE